MLFARSAPLDRLRASHLLLVALICLFAVESLAAEPAVAIEKIDAAVEKQMQAQRVPGVAVAVIDHGQVLLAKGYGEANVEHHVPVTDETIFQSGSVGKQFTAAAIMLLVEDGQLSLDDPIQRFFPDAPQAGQATTVRHLLTHTSGIPNFDPKQTDYRKDYTDDEFAQMAFALKRKFPPGSDWSYSNTGYVLLGVLIGKVTGKPYGDLLNDRIFKPLGMQTARIISETDIVPHRAAGYQLVNGELKNQEWVSPSHNRTADGSLYLSIRDLVAWDKGVREKAILKPESWQQIFTPVTLTDGKPHPYGFGWCLDDQNGQSRQFHGGAWQGFRTYISRYITADLTVIVLTNLGSADPETFVDAIAALFEPRVAPSKPSAN